MAKITIKGLDKLGKALKDNVTMNDVKKVVRYHGAQMHQKMQDNADFRGHWGWVPGEGRQWIKPTGTLKRSIHLEMEDGGFTAAAGPSEEYGEYVEKGTRYMDAQPFVKPAYDEQKQLFKQDMKKLVR